MALCHSAQEGDSHMADSGDHVFVVRLRHMVGETDTLLADVGSLKTSRGEISRDNKALFESALRSAKGHLNRCLANALIAFEEFPVEPPKPKGAGETPIPPEDPKPVIVKHEGAKRAKAD